MVEGEGDFDGAVGENNKIECGKDACGRRSATVERRGDRHEIPKDVEVAQRRHNPEYSNRDKT